MIGLPMMIGVMFIFAIVQISIFRALPEFIKNLLSYWLPLGVLLNFFGSFIILMFTGTAYFIGPVNLASSILFAFYIYGYKKAKNVRVVKKGKLRLPTLTSDPINKWEWLF